MILSGLVTVPLRAESPFLTWSMYSMPEVTLPQIVYLPSSDGASAAMMCPHEEKRRDLSETGPVVKAGSRGLPPLVPAALSKAVEIGRQNGFHRGRRDSQARQGQGAGRDDVVALQQLDLIWCQRRVRQNRHQPRLQPGDAEGEVDEPALSPDLLQKQFEQLAKCVDLGGPELVG